MNRCNFYKRTNKLIHAMAFISLLMGVLLTIFGFTYPLIMEVFFNENIQFDYLIEYIALIAVCIMFGSVLIKN